MTVCSAEPLCLRHRPTDCSVELLCLRHRPTDCSVELLCLRHRPTDCSVELLCLRHRTNDCSVELLYLRHQPWLYVQLNRCVCATDLLNRTNITFNPDELTLLNKSLKYNLSYKNKEWIKTLALEAEAAVNKLPVVEQDHIRFQVAHNIKLLYKQYVVC